MSASSAGEASSAPMRSAGCVVWRYGEVEPDVVVVHRPKYDDWSFPKGKLEPGERAEAAAVREVEEETGLRVRLGPRLRDDTYRIQSGQPKVVSYWVGHPPPDADISSYAPNNEIDQLAWLPLSLAARRLTHPRDVELLDDLTHTPFDSTPLVVVRHAEARKRKTWRGDDRLRPLAPEGLDTAAALVPLFAAYGVTRVVTSDSVRCVETMRPFVRAYDVKVRLEPGLSEEGASDKVIAHLAGRALAGNRRIAICTHRPVLPRMLAALGVEPEPLRPGGLVVVHRSDGKVLAVERAD